MQLPRNDHTDPQTDLPSPTIPPTLHERCNTFTLGALNNANPVRTLFGAPTVLLAEHVKRMYRTVITAKEMWAIAHRHTMATIESVLRTQKNQRKEEQIKDAGAHAHAPDFPFHSTLQANDKKKKKRRQTQNKKRRRRTLFFKKRGGKKARNTPKQQRKGKATHGPSPSST